MAVQEWWGLEARKLREFIVYSLCTKEGSSVTKQMGTLGKAGNRNARNSEKGCWT